MNIKNKSLNFGLCKKLKKLYNTIGINNRINQTFLNKVKRNNLENLKKKLILDSKLKIQLINIESFKNKIKLFKHNKYAKKKKIKI